MSVSVCLHGSGLIQPDTQFQRSVTITHNSKVKVITSLFASPFYAFAHALHSISLIPPKSYNLRYRRVHFKYYMYDMYAYDMYHLYFVSACKSTLLYYWILLVLVILVPHDDSCFR